MASIEIRPVDSICILEGRYRKELGDLQELGRSIDQKGLINPIVITRDNVLRSGERRLRAVRDILHWTHIEVRVWEEMSWREQVQHEYAENAARKDFTWQEKCALVGDYHEAVKSEDRTWTQEKTGADLNLKVQTVNDYLLVRRYREVSEIWNADTLPTAVNIARRLKDRASADESELILETAGMVMPENPVTGKCTSNRCDGAQHSIIRADFREFACTYRDRPFNFIHCDFPYGIESDSSGQGATWLGTYSDTESVFWQLCDTLLVNHSRLIAESAHGVFWFHPKFYCSFWDWLHDHLVELGWRFDEPPLVWVKSDERGIVPDPQRRPRRTHEIAFSGWRGDRKLTAAGPKANHFSGPLCKERLHPHEKPEPVLRHFFEMVVDGHTRMLDPTCGSGTSVRVARALGASTALGIEMDERFARDAQQALRKAA